MKKLPGNNQTLKILILVIFLLSSINATFIDSAGASGQPDHLNSLSESTASSPIAGCEMFPANNYWNTPIDTLPVHTSSAAWVNSIGASRGFHMDFGQGLWDGGPIGIPYNILSGNSPSVTKYTVDFYYPDESDPGPYPLTANPLREWGGDHHILVVDTDDCTLYELYDASKSGGQWDAGSGAIWDLNSNDLRPDTWTSADAAGLPILPGLVRYEEVLAGEIDHAIRFTASDTAGYIWPARHLTSEAQEGTPPMGARFRLKADYNIAPFSPQLQVILQAMKTYGIVLADNGSDWYVSGAPNEGWDNDMLHDLDVLEGSDFEAVDTSVLMVDPDSAATYNLPLVETIVRVNVTPNNASSVAFNVTFNRDVTGVNAADFVLTTSGVSGAAVSGISGSGSSYTVTVNTGSGDGTLRLDLVDDNSIVDNTSSPLGGPALNDGNFSGETYSIDKTAPTIMLIERGGINPNGGASVNFLVTFSEPVLNVDTADFVLATAQLSGANITSVNGSAATRVISVNTGSGDGTIQLNFVDNDTIRDLATNLISTTSLSGQTYAIDKPNLAGPVLRSPALNFITSDTTPTFQWRNVPGGATYEIQFATENSFTAPVHSNLAAVSPYTPPAFVEGLFYWRVRAYNSSNQPGAWSSVRTFTVDTTGPAAPTLSNPTTPSRTPTLRWSAPSGAVTYQFQMDTDNGFANPIYYTITQRPTSRKMPAMTAGVYYWHVRAQDALGNWGPWSTIATLTIP